MRGQLPPEPSCNPLILRGEGPRFAHLRNGAEASRLQPTLWLWLESGEVVHLEQIMPWDKRQPVVGGGRQKPKRVGGPAPALKPGHNGSLGIIAVVITKIAQANGFHFTFCSLAKVICDCLTSSRWRV